MDNTLILVLLPLVLVALALQIFALVDLYRRDKSRVQGGNKWVWLAVILLINPVGAIAYLLAGRTEGNGRQNY